MILRLSMEERFQQMAESIQKIFVDPPIAAARLGSSTTPQNAYKWVESATPRSNADTTIEPDWSLVVQADGTVEPVLPTSLAFRDGPLIRPVCPFFELWASIGESGSAPATWSDVQVTPDLLTKYGIALNSLVITIDAKNFKVSRRTQNPELQYGTFPPLRVRGDNHVPVPILAGSPPKVPAARRLIPANTSIPMGSLQVLKSRLQPAPDPSNGWTQHVNGLPVVSVEVIRFRFTPARGEFYGPPSAAQPQPVSRGVAFAPVEPSRAFLNPNAGWAGFNADVASTLDAPADTYDGVDVGRNHSLGVVDDTCELRIEVTLPQSSPFNQVLSASASVFVAPPDFAPDRRPFLSLADELNDRAADSAARTRAMSDNDRDAWVEDLFQRIHETLSLLNLDLWRREKAITLRGSRLNQTPIPGDETSEPSRAMGGRDMLRNQSMPYPGTGRDIKLPLTDYAHMRHRSLSDLDFLRDFVSQNPGRVAKLVRRSFEAESAETSDGIGNTTMRMPPFMRNSNAGPLTLAAWQYDLLMSWVNAMEAQPKPAVPASMTKEPSHAAIQRRSQVLTRINRGQQGSPERRHR
jgi:hypothetical protein